MSIDPTILSIPADNVAALANVATTIVAACAALFAFLGLRVWRQEMKGRRNAELAEDVLTAFYEAQDIYRWVRNPGSFAIEADGRARQDDEDEELARELDALFVPIARINNERESLSKFYAKRHRFRAIFGPDADAPFHALRKAESEVVSAANMLTRMAITDHRRDHRTYSVREMQAEHMTQEDQRREKYQARIWGFGDEDDEIAQRIDLAVKEIENICRPAIEARPK